MRRCRRRGSETHALGASLDSVDSSLYPSGDHPPAGEANEAKACIGAEIRH